MKSSLCFIVLYVITNVSWVGSLKRETNRIFGSNRKLKVILDRSANYFEWEEHNHNNQQKSNITFANWHQMWNSQNLLNDDLSSLYLNTSPYKRKVFGKLIRSRLKIQKRSARKRRDLQRSSDKDFYRNLGWLMQDILSDLSLNVLTVFTDNIRDPRFIKWLAINLGTVWNVKSCRATSDLDSSISSSKSSNFSSANNLLRQLSKLEDHYNKHGLFVSVCSRQDTESLITTVR
ncbi:hypothetical protein SK128_004539 [Halocaridina rubra]|uniref:Uncharacterized protein n=1 Tax=Halocaridina rubra TaxID=373956 RepID=A0AAN9ABZ4_HALRR